MLPILQGEAAPPPGPPGAPALAALLCSAEVNGDSYLPGYFSPFSSLTPNSDCSQDEEARLVSELQLGDSWGGIQGKMSVAAPVKKIKKKSDNKPQSQINKCNNEKRRRELENETINQLEELLGACLSDLRQPDKNGIVQEAAQQIRRVLDKRRHDANVGCNSCLPLQHGDVSSTHPSHHSEISALVESLKHFTSILGWVLLEISLEARIECVTENIRDIAGWDKADLVRQSFYHYLHYGDHHKLLPILQGASELGLVRAHSGRLQAARTRLRVKPAADTDGNGGEADKYVEVLLSACLVREVESNSSVLCLIRRQEEPAPTQGPPPRPMHQITFKLDTNFKIQLMEGANVSGIEGRRIHELIHPTDFARVSEHLQTALNSAGAPQVLIGPPPRLRLAPQLPYIAARPHSRLFPRNPTTNEPDFMMTTFTIVTGMELSVLESGNNNNNNNSMSQNPPMGGPLMTSAVVNGNGGPRNGQYPQSPASDTFSLLDEYFPGTTSWPERNSPSAGFNSFPFSPLPIDEPKMEEKPNISGSGPPTPSPRTPHTPSTTPLPPPTAPTPPALAPEPESGRLRNLLSIKHESPASTPTPTPEQHHHTAPNTPNPPTTPLGPNSAGNNLILKTLLKEEEEDPQRSGQPDTPSLPTNSVSHTNRATQGNNMLLKLLNEKSDEEDPEQRHNRNNTRSELLSQLLKDGINSNNSNTNSGSSYGGSTTITTVQALQTELGLDSTSSGEDLLQHLGHGGQMSALKRKLMQEEQMVKRPHSTDPQQVSSSNRSHSKLREKNRMLASLLEKQPSAITPPVPLPIPHLNQRPYARPQMAPQQPQQGQPHGPQSQIHPHLLQQRNNPIYRNQALANLLNNNKGPGYEVSNNNGPMSNANSISLSSTTSSVSGGVNSGPVTSGVNTSTVPSPLQQMLQGTHRSTPTTPTPPTSSNDYRISGTLQYMGDGSSDPVLSDILDQVMDIVPDSYTQDQSELINMIAATMEGPPPPGQPVGATQHHHNLLPANQVEKMAINRIQESLMQYETAVKSPSSPGVPPAYPTTTQGVSGGWGGHYTVSRQKTQLAVQQAQQKARLLQQQQQQLVVEGGGAATTPTTPSAPHHTQSMDALLNAPTPPNVSLQRTTDAPPYPQQPPPHYHHHHHHHGSGGGGFPGGPPAPPGPDTPPYKLTIQQQQNPMLNAQLTQSGYSGQRGSPLAPHTPLSPYPPPPRGGLQRHHSHPAQHSPAMQGYYLGDEGGLPYEGGGSMFLPPPPHPHHHPHPHPVASPHHINSHNMISGGMTSEFVRQELRTRVESRTGGAQGAGGGGGARPPDHLQPAPPDLESLGLTFEMPSSGGAGGQGVVVAGAGGGGTGTPGTRGSSTSHTTMWDTAHHHNTATANTNTMEEARGGDHKSSLLQKLLSE